MASASVKREPEAFDDDPVWAAAVNAPVDDMPETEEERAAVEAAKASGRFVPHDEVIAQLELRAAG